MPALSPKPIQAHSGYLLGLEGLGYCQCVHGYVAINLLLPFQNVLCWCQLGEVIADVVAMWWVHALHLSLCYCSNHFGYTGGPSQFDPNVPPPQAPCLYYAR